MSNVLGGPDSDTLPGTDGGDTIDGAGGGDSISGLRGNDSLSGDTGDDTIDGGSGRDTLIGGTGNDTLLAGSGSDSLQGQGGDDWLAGGPGAETAYGGTGNDTFEGGDGTSSYFEGDEGIDRAILPPGLPAAEWDLGISLRPAYFGEPFFNYAVSNAFWGGSPSSIGHTYIEVETLVFDGTTYETPAVLLVRNGFQREGNDGSLSVEFEFVLTRAVSTDVTFTFATANGSAIAGADYTAVDTVVTIPAGESRGSITVPILGDLIVEGNETFSVTFSDLVGAGLPGGFASATRTGTIVNDDGLFSVDDDHSDTIAGATPLALGQTILGSLEENEDQDVFSMSLVQGTSYRMALFAAASDLGSLEESELHLYDSSGALIASDEDAGPGYDTQLVFTAPETGTFYFGALPYGGAGFTGTYQARLDLASALPTLFIDDMTVSESDVGGLYVDVTVRTSFPLLTGGSISFSAQSVGGSATPGVDYDAVATTGTISSDQEWTTVRVAIHPDRLFEGDETIDIALSNPVNAVLAADATARLLILDDDATVVTISGAAVEEDDGATPLFTVGLQGAIQGGPVVVGYQILPGTGVPGVDISGAPTGQVTIPAGQTSVSIPAFAAGDALFEGPETVYARITSVSGGDAVAIGDPSDAQATILDDDAPPPVTVTGIASVGGAGPDVVQGAALADSLSGAGGDDVILAGRSGDALDGGAGRDFLIGDLTLDDLASTIGGADLIFGDADSDTVLAGAGNDTVTGQDGGDLLVGEAGNDLLLGEDGPDALYGGTGDDGLWGGAADDFMFGEAGADRMDGEAGNDRIYVDGDDLVADGGEGVFDVVVLTGPGPWTVSLADPLQQNAGGDGPRLLGFEAIDAAVAGGPVTITGWSFNGLGNVLYGSAFDDVITGSSAVDIILGGEGDDSIGGGAGGDSIGSEAGNDTISGGFGPDMFIYFNTALSGETVITDFEPGFDTIGLLSTTAADGVAALALAGDTEDGVVLTFAAGRSLTLLGVFKEDLAAGDFEIF